MRPLEVRNVAKRYPGGGFALGPVTFGVAAGQVLTVLGLNGAGKSTLLRIIAGSVRADTGEVLVGGRSRGNGPRDGLGVVLDGGRSLYWKMTVAENIDYIAALKGAPFRAMARRRRQVLADSGLEDKAGTLVGELSRGMQQRLVLAISLIDEPRVLLLDEPTLGVDFVHEDQIADAIQALQSRGCAIVLTSHQLDFVDRLADEALFLETGKAVEQRPMADLRRMRTSRVYEVELGACPDAITCERLRALGADIEDRQVRVPRSEDGDFYSLLDVLRPTPIVSCTIHGTDLRSVMQHYLREKAA